MDLESQILNEKPPIFDEIKNVEYVINLYDKLTEVVSEINTSQYQSASQNNPYQTISNQASAIYEKIKLSEQYQSNDQTVKKIAEGSRRIMEELFGEYRANLEYHP